MAAVTRENSTNRLLSTLVKQVVDRRSGIEGVGERDASLVEECEPGIPFEPPDPQRVASFQAIVRRSLPCFIRRPRGLRGRFRGARCRNLRPHYALTGRLWEQRLAARREAALRLVDERTFRAWRIWLAASSLSFEDGFNSVYQVLLGKRGAPRRRLTRESMYSEAVTY